jgi:hypothetical protein
MFPEGDTKFASLTCLGGADAGAVVAAGGASPKAAFVAAGLVVSRGPGVSDDAEHPARAAASSTPHNPAHPRTAAMTPPEAE